MKDNKNVVEQTLAIIKPDGIKNAIKIIEMIYNEGLKIEKYEVRMLDEEILKEHYAHIVDKPFYPKLENYMLSSEVVLMILEGVNAVDKLRNLMGPTDSTKAQKGTIRGEFGTDITYNAIHGSDSKENAEIEINRFFRQKQKRI
ncbi:MAG: nucleoside-diphosphate kinase [Firmicutes bacterium]|nr:nucleoside-diphosphate kinase [Bacillota bacterium]